VLEAADQLGISEGAVRNRIKRGTLQVEREAGRVYVLLAGATSRDKPPDESELVSVLREQLAAERQAHAEARRSLMAALERIPALEPPESPEPPSEPPANTAAPPEAEDPAETRPWWRRMFGG